MLIVEDLYGSGKSIKTVREKILEQEPASLKLAMAFHMKMEVNIKVGYFADYIGFIIPDHFVIGFGLDYNEHFRDLPHLCIINKHGIDTFKT